MRNGEKRAKALKSAELSTTAAQLGIGDRTTQKLMRAGHSVGNDEFNRRINQGNASRDELLTYLCHRLQTIHQMQKREMAKSSRFEMREVWKQISDSHASGVTKPEPQRWHETARLYEDAAYQLCQGKLGRGSNLIKQAMDAEKSAMEKISSHIHIEDIKERSEQPGALDDIIANQVCSPRDMPEEVDLARQILGEGAEMKDPPNRDMTLSPWWTELEEEEEEEEGDGGG